MSVDVPSIISAELIRWLIAGCSAVGLGLAVRSALFRSSSHGGSVEERAFMSMGSDDVEELSRLLDVAVTVAVGDSCDLDEALLFVYAPDEGWTRLASSGDVYQLLDDVGRSASLVRQNRGISIFGDDVTAVGIVSSGWGAPLVEGGSDVAPSQNPERVRVRVSVACDGFTVGSTVAFDDPGRESLTSSDGDGPLASAVLRVTRESLTL